MLTVKVVCKLSQASAQLDQTIRVLLSAWGASYLLLFSILFFFFLFLTCSRPVLGSFARTRLLSRLFLNPQPASLPTDQSCVLSQECQLPLNRMSHKGFNGPVILGNGENDEGPNKTGKEEQGQAGLVSSYLLVLVPCLDFCFHLSRLPEANCSRSSFRRFLPAPGASRRKAVRYSGYQVQLSLPLLVLGALFR